ncbi:hypothetical protein LTR37_018852 [Vermiconidia calcicola]|uniref:Uncharacterized protein n=1 Tax=Vermiconidia calcicola TaxID=1690605 RepID=A0ACC3MFU3_9PEZI|nr:hypothetical protein LTR37_018852 [Vermiconidia calcicola]
MSGQSTGFRPADLDTRSTIFDAEPLSPSSEHQLNVYKVRFKLAMQDPDMPANITRYHTVLFVETADDGSGHIHHVTGDITAGMEYQRRPSPRPQNDESYFNRELLGTVPASRYPADFDIVCSAQPAPPKQKAFNMSTRRTEPFKPDGSFYGSGEPRRSLTKCTEWTEKQAIPALRQEGLIR